MSEQKAANGNGSAIVKSPKEKRGDIEQLITKSRASWAALLPAHIKPDVMYRSAMAAISKTPQLVQCSPASIVMALAQACSLGLPPNTPLGLGYLIPFKGACTFIPGYKGLLRLAVQSGEVTSIETDVIRQHDAYEIHRGTDSRLEHSYALDRDRGEVVGFYAVATMKTGGKVFEFMTKREVDAIRARSKSKDDGPWVTDYEQMGRKTALRRLSNYLPLSEEKLARAMELQAAAEAGEVDFSDVIDTVGEVVNAETGEVTEEPSRTESMKERLEKKAAAS